MFSGYLKYLYTSDHETKYQQMEKLKQGREKQTLKESFQFFGVKISLKISKMML